MGRWQKARLRKSSTNRPRPSRQAETGDPDLNAAATALRDKFLEKFRVQLDISACKLHKDKNTWLVFHNFNIEPKPTDYSGLAALYRSFFHKHLDTWHLNFTGFFQDFVHGLLELRNDLPWVQRESEKMLVLLRDTHQDWAIVACEGYGGVSGWLAPCWLDNWPAQIQWPAMSAAELDCRLDARRTKEVLKAVGSRTGAALASALRIAISDLRLKSLPQKQEFSPATDYSSAVFRGTTYNFTRLGAKIVQVLHSAYLEGHPVKTQDSILSAIDSPKTSQVRDAFRRNPAWGNLIVSVGRGRYRLDLPDQHGPSLLNS